MFDPEGQSYMLCFQDTHQDRAELPESGMRGIRNYLGNGKVCYFLYGKEFTLETDQKPLVSIYKKHMVDISPRVQRLIVRSFPYLPFKVVYRKGTDIPVADALSCVTPMDPEDNS